MTDARRTAEAERRIVLKILRCDGPSAPTRWESFSLPWRPMMNVISCLMEIQKDPVTTEGKRTTPPVWDCNCLEEVCGACTMIVNGRPRQACSALVDSLVAPIELRPLAKFPLVRDLAVDRKRMFDALVEEKAWIPIDGTHALGPGPRIGDAESQVAYDFSRCMTCGCCMEVCPNYHARSTFLGPAPLAQVHRFLLHPTGKLHEDERLDAVMGPGGITDCGKAQNCVKVCPKDIPLTEGLAQLSRATSRRWLRSLFGA
jgi:succinate dehydrogenase / fumarate reductase iron-sulfur subunit